MSQMTSQFTLEDMAQLWGPSYLTVDPMGSLLDQDEMVLPAEGVSPPLACVSTSPLSSLSPPSSPGNPQLCDKERDALLPLPWLAADELTNSHVGASSVKDAFSGMEWMAERMDLSDLDLDSFLGSCEPEDPPSSPEDLVASLESLETLPSPESEVVLLADAPAQVPDVQTELEIKSEPPSPVPSPSILPPPSPACTFDLCSEVDVSEKVSIVEVPQVPRIVLSLSPTRIVLVLAPKQEEGVSARTVAATPVPDFSDSDRSSDSGSPASRTRPGPSPVPDSRPAPELPAKPGKVKTRVEKKQRKMEQNKTAATRYRQKKRAEQEALQTECTQLEQRNRQLIEKAGSITKEIQYLKDLMDEVRQAVRRKVESVSG
ncbi:activating transcription factor 4b isoform X2 [Denticeps clupeoides]|uniref:activating transcription factor 4b isoform X2 n=1 Tax=Denticeps clupeoides TaxID=299321 RepID=UPI0010A4F095|nr:cyclic AMP-dependent transcription factor ATF-4-like isoform X2 [Denticeps clupeoides]